MSRTIIKADRNALPYGLWCFSASMGWNLEASELGNQDAQGHTLPRCQCCAKARQGTSARRPTGLRLRNNYRFLTHFLQQTWKKDFPRKKSLTHPCSAMFRPITLSTTMSSLWASRKANSESCVSASFTHSASGLSKSSPTQIDCIYVKSSKQHYFVSIHLIGK